MKKVHVVLFMAVLMAVSLVNFGVVFADFGRQVALGCDGCDGPWWNLCVCLEDRNTHLVCSYIRSTHLCSWIYTCPSCLGL